MPTYLVNYNILVSLFRAAYEQIHRGSGFDSLQFINASTDTQIVTSLRGILESTGAYKISEEIPNWLTKYANPRQSNQSRERLHDLLNNAIMFIGKTYDFFQFYTVDKLFSKKLITGINKFNVSNEYFKMLARIAVTDELQRKYFELFNARYKNVLSYQSNDYLCGYWRILRWYFDCKYSNSSFDYRTQFKLIIKYLLEADNSQLTKEYKVNAFSSLIYLLTFCEIDSEFCRVSSEEMGMAAEVIERFRNDRTIRSNQVSRGKLLNDYFEQLITGESTESDMIELLSAS